MNTYAFIGMICGALVGVLIVYVALKLTRDDKNSKSKFDERQEALRGRAFKCGFFTFVGYYCLMSALDISDVNLPMEDSVTYFLGVILGLAVFATVAVKNDAYIALNENYNKVMIIFALIAVVNLVTGGINFSKGLVVIDGKASYCVINILCGLVFVYLLIICEIHNSRKNDLEDDDEES